MHKSAYDEVKDIIERHRMLPMLVYDIGSYDVNGTYRTLFGDDVEYVGYDVRLGPGVDVVMQSPDRIVDKAGRQCDLALCCSTLEHCANPFDLILEARCVTRRGGYIVLCAPFVWPVHDHPADYWRFTDQGLRMLLETCGFGCLEAYMRDIKGKPKVDAFAVGRRF